MRIGYREQLDEEVLTVAEGDGEVLVQVDTGAIDPLYLSIREESPGVLRLRTCEGLTLVQDSSNAARAVLWVFALDEVVVSAGGVVRRSPGVDP